LMLCTQSVVYLTKDRRGLTGVTAAPNQYLDSEIIRRILNASAQEDGPRVYGTHRASDAFRRQTEGQRVVVEWKLSLRRNQRVDVDCRAARIRAVARSQ
jgi:hypothetical protein